MITEKYKDIIRTCVQCGTCTAACPSKYASDFNIRKVIRHLQLDMHTKEGFLERYPWLCALCNRCKELCIEELDIPSLVFGLRELALEKNFAPDGVNKTLEMIKESDSPFKSLSRTKKTWAESAQTSDDADTLYWVGCTPAIMMPNVAQSSAEAMNKLGLEFKLLDSEPCCGEPTISLGLVEESKEIAAKAVESIKSSNVKKLVTGCSGCYNTFTKLYPEHLGVELPDIEILHLSQLLEKESSKNLKLEKPMKLTYHDPCSLGRHTSVYDPPRKVLESIEGVTLVETQLSKEFSGCCGGGGGMLSLNNDVASEIALGRIKRDIMPLGVDGIVTSCPTCILNFNRTVKKSKLPLKVYDLAEVVAMSSKN